MSTTNISNKCFMTPVFNGVKTAAEETGKGIKNATLKTGEAIGKATIWTGVAIKDATFSTGKGIAFITVESGKALVKAAKAVANFFVKIIKAMFPCFLETQAAKDTKALKGLLELVARPEEWTAAVNKLPSHLFLKLVRVVARDLEGLGVKGKGERMSMANQAVKDINKNFGSFDAQENYTPTWFAKIVVPTAIQKLRVLNDIDNNKPVLKKFVAETA